MSDAPTAETGARRYIMVKAGQLMGRLANGFESDQGKLIHAVPDDCGHYDSKTKAICGAKPGRRSCGWDVDNMQGKQVNCERCIKRYARSRR